jgi:hypothetical protein
MNFIEFNKQFSDEASVIKHFTTSAMQTASNTLIAAQLLKSIINLKHPKTLIAVIALMIFQYFKTSYLRNRIQIYENDTIP